MRIRSALITDVPRIMEIGAETSTAAHWSEHSYLTIFTQSLPRRLAFVIEHEFPDYAPEILGFIVLQVVVHDWEIENIAVVATQRQRGLATRLLRHALQLAVAEAAEQVFLEVRESNISAFRFYEKCGFGVKGRRKHYYSYPEEDALVMALIGHSILEKSVADLQSRC